MFFRIEVCGLVEFDSTKHVSSSNVKLLVRSLNNKNQVEEIQINESTNKFCKLLPIGSYIIEVRL